MSSWRTLTVATDRTHHIRNGRPAYETRFNAVQKFHSPGLAPVKDGSGAFHINQCGKAAYDERYLRTFGFYEDRAAVQNSEGWFHISLEGTPIYPERYSWCGNFQEGRCPVRHEDRSYSHVMIDGRPAYQERYRYAGDYRDGYAVVQRLDELHTHIDSSGGLLHGKWFVDLDVYHKGIARARDERGWYHIGISGRSVYDRRLKAVEPFYNGLCRAETREDSLIVIDETGKTVLVLRQGCKDSSHAQLRERSP